MRLGIGLPTTCPDGSALTGEALIAAAQLIERVGFDSLWCFDTIGRDAIVPDPLIALAVAAAVTETGRGWYLCPPGTVAPSGGTGAPYSNRPFDVSRPPVARRLVAGSTQADFDAIGVDYTQRLRLFEEALPVMRRLWQGEQVEAANLKPWPATIGGPPLLIGSWRGTRWIPRAAQEFDGWIASAAMTSFNTLAEGIARYRAAGGKRAMVTNIGVDLDAPTTELEDDAPFHLRCAPETAAARLQRLVELGFDDAILVHRAHTEARLTAMRALV